MARLETNTEQPQPFEAKFGQTIHIADYLQKDVKPDYGKPLSLSFQLNPSTVAEISFIQQFSVNASDKELPNNKSISTIAVVRSNDSHDVSAKIKFSKPDEDSIDIIGVPRLSGDNKCAIFDMWRNPPNDENDSDDAFAFIMPASDFEVATEQMGFVFENQRK